MSQIHPLAIGIIEDDEVLLDNYSHYFSMQPGYLLSFAYPSILVFQASFSPEKNMQPDIVLLDIKLPDISGIDGIRILRPYFPQAAIIMLTAYEDEKTIISALKNGANGYLVKSLSLFKIHEILQELAEGGTTLASSVERTLIQHMNAVGEEEPIMLAELTRREKEIVHCITDGLTYKEAGLRLGITSHTVNQHLKKVYSKLNVNSKAELVSKLLKNR